MKFLANLHNKITKLREQTYVPFFHICPVPPKELMAVIARLGTINLWEQRRCAGCGKISHWRRDAPSEPLILWKTLPETFMPWVGHPGGTPIDADLSDCDLRNRK
ncbi:MAG: hypothetical protein Q7J30_01655 [Candidatus Azambacteria bacterium]|nr:hypothetical protein [Candidatus Azambacteria bacterium]